MILDLRQHGKRGLGVTGLQPQQPQGQEVVSQLRQGQGNVLVYSVEHCILVPAHQGSGVAVRDTQKACLKLALAQLIVDLLCRTQQVIDGRWILTRGVGQVGKGH